MSMNIIFQSKSIPPRLWLQIRLWAWLVNIVLSFLAIHFVGSMFPLMGLSKFLIMGMPIFLSAVGIYSEYCPQCGLLGWAKGESISSTLFSSGPFWIPRKCPRCGTA
jgi:hypothetical protein